MLDGLGQPQDRIDRAGLVEERLFLWTESNEVLVRYLLDVGVTPGELRQWRG